MKEETSIVPALPADVAAIVEIENLSFGAERFSARQFRYLITQAKGAFYVARGQESHRVWAYISLLANTHCRRLRIYSIAVHPDARHSGLGQRLIDEAFRYARARGLDTLSLEVRVDNAPARALYEKNGFHEAAFLPGYFCGADAHRMTASISMEN
jgi:ribosomal protein S18 acetylase RimI-like enzyme